MLRIVLKDGRYKYHVTHIKIDGDEGENGVCVEHTYKAAVTSRIEGRFKMVIQKKTDSDYTNVRAEGLEEVSGL